MSFKNRRDALFYFCLHGIFDLAGRKDRLTKITLAVIEHDVV